MDNETIKKRIRALLDKTIENGCTAEEAVAAAAKAAELMRKYNIDKNEIEIMFVEYKLDVGNRSVRSNLWPIVIYYTNTRAIYDSASNKMIFFGKYPWPEIASYLLDVCDHAIVNEVKRFKKLPTFTKRPTVLAKKRAVSDFTISLINRLDDKIRLLFGGTISQEEQRNVEEYLEKKYLGETTPTKLPPKTQAYADAAADGWRAGENVNISHGVNGTEDFKKLQYH